MSWQPISERAIKGEIAAACERMSVPQRKLWEAIRVTPEKWRLDPWGNEGGGFWVVGLIENVAVWYNDIEEGFNRSPFTRHGRLDEYWCNQDELEITMQFILNDIVWGKINGPSPGPSQNERGN